MTGDKYLISHMILNIQFLHSAKTERNKNVKENPNKQQTRYKESGMLILQKFWN